MPGASTDDTGRRAALAILAIAMAAAAGALLYWGRGGVMVGDDLLYAQRLSENDLGQAVLHTNLYLIALPMAFYKAMFEVFGIGSYIPYRLAAIILALVCATLFYLIARSRIGSLPALAPTILLLFFGSGWEVLITGARIPSLFGIASGLGAILFLDREDARGDVFAAVLLCISVTSHPSGLGFLAAAAVMVAFRHSPQRWRSSWVVVIPAALLGAFLLFYQRSAGPQPQVSDVLAFVRDSWTTLTAAVSGLSGALEAPVHDQLLAQIASIALLAVILVGVALRWKKLRSTFWAALAGLVTLLVATRLAPGGSIEALLPGRAPDAPRYLYPESVLFLWILVELAAAWRDSGTHGVRTLVGGFATAVLLLGLWSNLVKLSDASLILRTNSAIAEGQYSAYDLERDRLRPNYRPNPFAPTAGGYLSASAAYGSMGLSASELSGAPQATRAAADRTLVGLLGLSLTPAEAKRAPGCATRSQPVELRLPPGGAWIAGDRLGDATLTLGRFADPPVARLPPQPGAVAKAAVLRIPPDGVAVPWRLQVTSPDPVTVCGLPGS